MAFEPKRPGADIVVFGSFGASGGIQRRLANVITEWHKRGFRVDLVSYAGGVCFYPDEIADKVNFVDLGTNNRLSTLIQLWRYLRREHPAAILSTMHRANLIVARLDYLPDTGTRRILSVPNSFGESQKRPPKKKASKLKEVRTLYPRAHGVVAISNGVKSSLTETVGLEGVPIHCIYNGSVTKENKERAKLPVDHPWIGEQSSAKVVVTAGRLAKQKDQKRLIEAVHALRTREDVRLIIIGEGPLRQELEDFGARLGEPKEWLSMPGHCSNPYPYMAKADCFVLCSLWEGFPNVLAEALGVGARVVATDFPSGARDILSDGRYGHLVPMEDTCALKDAIARVLEGDYPEYRIDNAVEEFTAETAAKRYLDVFGLNY